MRFPVGPRGLTLLAVTAVVGLVLALHGWSGRHSGQVPGALAGAGASTGPAASAAPSGPSAPASSAAPTARRTARPGASSTSPGASPGPLLSSQSFASQAFQVWPGTPSAAARAALTGLSISVRRHGSGVLVTAGVSGQPAGAPRFYPNGTRVYVIEASLGDDSGSSDYSLGDDGLVVTNALGRIVP
jgi:hypothetical protein